VTHAKEKIGMSRGERHPPILYFLIIALLAVKLLEVVADLINRRGQLVAHHYDVPHLGSNVWCDVVALQKCCLVDLLVSPVPEKSCETSLGLRVDIVGSRIVTVYNCMDCHGTGDSFLGNILGEAICTSDAGDEVKVQLQACLISQHTDPYIDSSLYCCREGWSGRSISWCFIRHGFIEQAFNIFLG